MASDTYYFKGVAYWAKVQKPDEKFGNYVIDLYLDKNSLLLLKDSGLELKLRESENGTYVKFRRTPEKLIKGDIVKFGKPKVYLEQNGTREPFEGKIGNGSDVTCKVSIYDTPKGKGHSLEAIVIDNLVPYEGGEVHTPDADFIPF